MAPQPKNRIVIDCDPGQDDAIALLLAFGAADDLEILGITTVGGNVGLDLTQRNARLVCDLAGHQEIPVYAGCSRPLVRDPVVADYYHGPTGMGGFPIGQPVTPLRELHAVNFLAQTLMAEADNSVTLACLAPLTNIAMALVMEPRLKQKIKQIVFMGGAQREGGNTTPTASFNVFCDPHAAHVVLMSGIPFVWVNLDVTHKLVMTQARLKAISAIGNAAAKVVHDMLTWDHARRLANYGAGADGLPVSDLSVIAYLLRPELFSGRDLNVVIDLQSTYAFGMTVVDIWGLSDRPANAFWLQDVDDQGVFDLLVEALRRV